MLVTACLCETGAIDHLGFARNDPSSAVAAMAAAGVTITMAYGENGPFAFASDPAGLWFEVMAPQRPPQRPKL